MSSNKCWDIKVRVIVEIYWDELMLSHVEMYEFGYVNEMYVIFVIVLDLWTFNQEFPIEFWLLVWELWFCAYMEDSWIYQENPVNVC